jgi:hypothetical protein
VEVKHAGELLTLTCLTESLAHARSKSKQLSGQPKGLSLVSLTLDLSAYLYPLQVRLRLLKRLEARDALKDIDMPIAAADECP